MSGGAKMSQARMTTFRLLEAKSTYSSKLHLIEIHSIGSSSRAQIDRVSLVGLVYVRFVKITHLHDLPSTFHQSEVDQ